MLLNGAASTLGRSDTHPTLSSSQLNPRQAKFGNEFKLASQRSLPELAITHSTKRSLLMRFGIRRLLFIVAGAAVVCALYVAARNLYFAERHQTESALAEVRGISDIQLHSYMDTVEEVNGSRFSVDGLKNSVIKIGSLSHYGDKRRFSLNQIGKWTFRTSGRRHMGAYQASTGAPVESDYIGWHVELGPNSPYNELIPFEINTLQDVVDHYQELVDLFETWPREANPGTVTLEDGTTQFFYVVRESE